MKEWISVWMTQMSRILCAWCISWFLTLEYTNLSEFHKYILWYLRNNYFGSTYYKFNFCTNIWNQFFIFIWICINNNSLYSLFKKYWWEFLKKFVSWFQISKFDMRFVTVQRLIDLMGWKVESERMASIQFYCQTTFLNYLNLLMIAILILFTISILKHYQIDEKCHSIY